MYCALSLADPAAASRARPRCWREMSRGQIEYNVFLVPLQGLDVSREIDTIVGDYLDDARHNSSCLPESPIDWIRYDPNPLLLIFRWTG